jgi:hypothetical protein
MEYADGGLYQQSALSGALNKPGFPHRGLTCLAITFIHDHLDHCLEDALHADHTESDKTLSEFKEITKYL